MIKYKLKCKNCSETFDSWFASSKEFEKLKKLKLISCNSCNSLKIDKSIMSPRISPRMNNINEKKSKNQVKLKLKLESSKHILKKIFNMLETILLTKPDQFITEIRNPKKEFMGMLLQKKLKI